MALLYDPGTFMPRHHDEFSWMSWMMTWPTGPWHLHDLMPGGTVYLVRAGSTQRIMWETTVVRSFAVPYEAVGSLAAEVWLRWGLTIDTRNMNAGGFCIGWQAEPVALLDRGPIESADSTTEVASDRTSEVLDLDGFQQTDEMTPEFLRRWGLTHDDDAFCTGRSPIGWFGSAARGASRDQPISSK